MIKKRPDWAQRLRDARENKNLSQREVVKRLKSNQTTIVYYETGNREPRIGYLMGLIKSEFYLLWHKAFKNSRYTEGYACEFLKTFYHQHLSTPHPQKSLNSG
jgi:transcriptional regulator with XRE-family HTH domain